MTHICVGKLNIIGSDNGLSPGRRQAIIWTNARILSIRPLATNFNEILIGIQTFSFTKMYLKMSSAKWRPFCLGLNVLSFPSYNMFRPYRGWVPLECHCQPSYVLVVLIDFSKVARWEKNIRSFRNILNWKMDFHLGTHINPEDSVSYPIPCIPCMYTMDRVIKPLQPLTESLFYWRTKQKLLGPCCFVQIHLASRFLVFAKPRMTLLSYESNLYPSNISKPQPVDILYVYGWNNRVPCYILRVQHIYSSQCMRSICYYIFVVETFES